jgi:hypothetical protein
MGGHQSIAAGHNFLRGRKGRNPFAFPALLTQAQGESPGENPSKAEGGISSLPP